MTAEPSPEHAAGRQPSIRILLITPNFENNSLGRTYCLWLLAKELGWSVRIVGITGAAVWGPLEQTPFAADCTLLGGLGFKARSRALEEAVAWSDVVLAVKPLPTSLGLAARTVAAVPRPLMVDIDDPDIEYRTSWQPLRRRLRARVDGSHRELLSLGRLARTLPRLVSNPVLQDWYGGVVIPHVRPEGPVPAYSQSRAGSDREASASGPVTVRFVGSPRGHKGVDVLRRSIAAIQDTGIRLEITADPPVDAMPWESWLGQTSFDAGTELVASADIVAVPSLARSWAVAQLPAKVIDAMMAGRAVVASDVAPVRWALAGTGLLVPPGDAQALASGLRELCDPARRRTLGTAAYLHAVEHFAVRSVAPAFAAAVNAALVPDRETAPRSLVVAVLTFRRTAELAALLPELDRQVLDCQHRTGLVASVLVIDNDPEASAEPVVDAGPRLRYVCESSPGIAAARNRALTESATVDLLVFIDDDETPQEGWLVALAQTYLRSAPAGVVGPVASEFAVEPGEWVTAGGFFDRRRLATGSEVPIAASNNLLLDLRQIRRLGLTFDERFGISGGSDTLFSHQLVSRGGRLVWCAEAMVVDRVPPSRVTVRWVLLRALRSGNSWSRTVLDAPAPRLVRARRRADLSIRGGVRLAGGSARFLAGVAIWSKGRQARGLRTAARGLGMLGGAHGYVYSEYRRRPGPRQAGRFDGLPAEGARDADHAA